MASHYNHTCSTKSTSQKFTRIVQNRLFEIVYFVGKETGKTDKIDQIQQKSGKIAHVKDNWKIDRNRPESTDMYVLKFRKIVEIDYLHEMRLQLKNY